MLWPCWQLRSVNVTKMPKNEGRGFVLYVNKSTFCCLYRSECWWQQQVNPDRWDTVIFSCHPALARGSCGIPGQDNIIPPASSESIQRSPLIWTCVGGICIKQLLHLKLSLIKLLTIPKGELKHSTSCKLLWMGFGVNKYWPRQGLVRVLPVFRWGSAMLVLVKWQPHKHTLSLSQTLSQTYRTTNNSPAHDEVLSLFSTEDQTSLDQLRKRK